MQIKKRLLKIGCRSVRAAALRSIGAGFRRYRKNLEDGPAERAALEKWEKRWRFYEACKLPNGAENDAEIVRLGAECGFSAKESLAMANHGLWIVPGPDGTIARFYRSSRINAAAATDPQLQ
ncbi:hypothetical protein [Rhizobium sp. CSW-27]|uniref:hypothetical protein n=1 Tax=Rhizobium sp. CSW-27 TaxID=2839985 RepID=UPI001C020A92|nr:hypothetical protein [Rhizobium sp. CSW-27]MBT9370298.1 hypothetical protein [Rhizobium sp. CSW-27]